jgi:hypothetical protein
MERDLVIHHEVDRMTSMKVRVVQAQKELNEYIIDSWKTKQKEDIDNNLEAYVTTLKGETAPVIDNDNGQEPVKEEEAQKDSGFTLS